MSPQAEPVTPWRDVRQIGAATLYLGDCVSIAPHVSGIDATVTDPPYSSGGFTQSAISKAKGQGLRSETIRREGWFAGDAMTAAGESFLLRELASLLFDRSSPKGTFTTFTDWRVAALYAPAIESARWRYQNLIVWDKGTAGLGTGFRAQHELALHFSKGAPEYFSASYGNVLRVPRVTAVDKRHPTEKPCALISQIVEVVAPPGGLVFDPFMGSGTTGVACVSMGRRFVGVEVDPGNLRVACDRLEQAVARGPELLTAPPAEQTAMDV